ncbi:hypothetical protein H6F67_21160 [Microcoleus sp. FACHB-1515]|uniref:hypothetical protein n=1 Tax=Cyanophyceae TaxID=3028117 RepID=UPI001683B73D|nr:hypothetical protein [Microcoleus sp. FACHB-1515]MBD2092362.1 hypothetical protein [Microcoleus sp. FACHB-1515]
MITVYKTSYELHGKTYVRCFSFSAEVSDQIDRWQAVWDKIVFDEQVKTGSFRGRFQLDDFMLQLLRAKKEQGIIRPYYGASGGNPCLYKLQIKPSTCLIRVTHSVEENTEVEAAVTILQAAASVVAQNHQRGLMIGEQEYCKLQQWRFWRPRDEFTGRYVYQFAPASIGLEIQVTDTRSQETIDITDWNW